MVLKLSAEAISTFEKVMNYSPFLLFIYSFLVGFFFLHLLCMLCFSVIQLGWALRLHNELTVFKHVLVAFCQTMCVFTGLGVGKEEQKSNAVSQDCNPLLSLQKTVSDPIRKNIHCCLLFLKELNRLRKNDTVIFYINILSLFKSPLHIAFIRLSLNCISLGVNIHFCIIWSLFFT